MTGATEPHAGRRIAVLGASGFMGRAVLAAVAEAGHIPVAVHAPRLTSAATSAVELVREADQLQPGALLDALCGAGAADLLINAAGRAAPGAAPDPSLTGANALLPTVLARSSERAAWTRIVHISSAAVHGVGTLDERDTPRPESPYARSKWLGEQGIEAAEEGRRPLTVVLRPTSVHGHGRPLTRSLTSVARSPLSSVAGRGDRPTPQVLVENVASAAVYLSTCPDIPANAVLQPWEGVTTGGLLRGLSGRDPKHIPVPVAAAALTVARTTGRLHPRIHAQARRLEMLWFGQPQVPGWLDSSSWAAPRCFPEGLTPAL